MMDFTQSLKIGLQAAQEQIEKRNEIQTIFHHLSEQISQYLRFEIKIYPRTYHDTVYRKEKRIIIINELNHRSRWLAVWSDTDGAYPCSIHYGNEAFLCENKKDLELALSTMLQNADVAKQLLNFKAENEVSL